MRTARIVKLSSAPDGAIRLLSDRVSLAEGQRESWETITRVVKFEDPYYGEVNITRAMLNRMVRNFGDSIYGQIVAVDIAHNPSAGAAGFIRELSVESNKLRGRIEWTDFGVEAVTRKGFRYFSAEYHENWKDPETGKKHGTLLQGAALTTRPRVKRLDPVDPSALSLSLDGDESTVVLVAPRMTRILLSEVMTTMTEYLKKLRAALEKKKLAAETVDTLCTGFEKAAGVLGDDEEALKQLAEQFEATGDQLVQLSAEGGESGIQLNIAVPDTGAHGLSEDDVKRLLAEQREAERQAQAEREEKRAANVKLFTAAIDAQEGFDDELKKQLTESVDDLITADMGEAQVKALSEAQIKLGNTIAAQAKLAGMGYEIPGAAGSVHIDIDTRDDSKKLHEQIVDGLKRTSAYANRRLRLADEVAPFVDMVLSEFDRLHAPRIHAEVTALAGGQTGISDTDLPVGFQRTVIREALSDLRVLELVQTLIDATATATTQIPYEQRDTSDVQNDGVVYEGQPIHRASVSQAMDLAYILPMKLAFLVSNEVMHFSRISQINWDAYARNVESNARVMRELIVRRICNELQRCADAYGAVAVTGEDISGQLDGSTHTIKTSVFPLVRPHQQKDLQGNNVGAEENPITLVVNGNAVTAYDGTGDQAAGTYYRVTSYNLGYVQLVNEAGAPQTPTASGACTIGYSRATNVLLWDTDVPGGTTLEKHWNGFLQKVGARKAMMSADRFILPDFMLMSPVLNDMASNAENFVASQRRDGADTNSQGDLAAVKGIPAFGTNAPAVDLGDERCLIGVRGTLSYVLNKPFITGQPVEAVDSNGKFIGKKQAYGEEYSAIKVPVPIRNRLTSVIAYSASGR